ncbi:hypothetical protein ACEWY4_004607 [Coilia grayii]|uniref:G-protein coupled receptors family 1 profile domain-containing protein n=1 Tax=Coilia grayii TaxID=363190 RepID=A0ABD1KM31_9TELE
MNYPNNSSSLSPGEQAAAALRGLCFLLGVPGNVAVLTVLLRHFKRKNFTTQLMLNLAAADILCLLTLPFWTLDLILGWTMGLVLCKFICFVAYTSIHASVLTITLMSVHRYVGVMYSHQWSRLGKCGERGLLVGVWVLAGIFAIPPIITYSVTEVTGKPHCEQIVGSETEKFGVLLLEIVLIYLLPLIILMTSYFSLHRHVSERAISRHRLTPLVTCIIVTFVIFSTPYVVVNIMTIVRPLSGKEFAYKHLRAVVQGIVFLNSCVDPLLYAFNIPSLRQNAQARMSEQANRAQTQPRTRTPRSRVQGGPEPGP